MESLQKYDMAVLLFTWQVPCNFALIYPLHHTFSLSD